MTEFLNKWNLWLFGVSLLIVTAVSAWTNGWSDDNRTSLIIATIWLAAAEVKNSEDRRLDKKFTEK